MHAVLADAGAHPAFFQLSLDPADYLEDVVKGVEMVVRATFELAGERELGEDAEQLGESQRGFEGRAEVQRL